MNYQRIAFIGALLGVTFILLEPKLAGSRDGSFAVNGQKLHIEILGTFAPTVVFEAGLGNDSTTWKFVAGPIATAARVVLYDRAGLGQSLPLIKDTAVTAGQSDGQTAT